MTDKLARAVDRLSRIPGVRGALIVDAEAGVPVVTELADEMVAPGVAALATSAYRRTTRATADADLGTLESLQVEAAGGHVLVTDAGALLVVVVAEPAAQLGRVRVEARQVAETLV